MVAQGNEAAGVLGEARSHAFMGPAVWIQILAALRVEAIMGLDWGNSVLWDENQFLICRAWKAKVKRLEDYPKGKDWEYVPMIPVLKAYLHELWVACGQPQSEFVCQGPRGGMLPYSTYLQGLARLCKKARVPTVTTHELRHSSSEMWVQEGATQEDIRRLLNHTSLSATKRYLHARTSG